MVTELRERFEIRWKNLVERSSKFGLNPPDKEALYSLLLHSVDRGFFCNYCGVHLEVKDPVYPYYRSFSFEHKQSLFFKGTNDLDNITVVCHRCNITKGPMSETIFREIIRYLPKPLFESFCTESFKGKIASEMERQGLGRNAKNE